MERRRAAFRGLFILFGALALGVGLFAAAKHYQKANVRYAILVKPGVAVYNGPSETFSKLAIVPEGAKVQRLAFDNPAWAHIMLMDGPVGFTQSENTKPI